LNSNNILLLIFFTICGIFIFIFSLSILFNYLERRVVQNKYEWLVLLSHYEWKQTRRLRKEILVLKKVKSFLPLGMWCIYTDFVELEDEGLIESREKEKTKIGQLSLLEYRLKPGGVKKKLDVLNRNKETLNENLQTN
jgi:hypothetical protein